MHHYLGLSARTLCKVNALLWPFLSPNLHLTAHPLAINTLVITTNAHKRKTIKGYSMVVNNY